MLFYILIYHHSTMIYFGEILLNILLRNPFPSEHNIPSMFIPQYGLPHFLDNYYYFLYPYRPKNRSSTTNEERLLLTAIPLVQPHRFWEAVAVAAAMVADAAMVSEIIIINYVKHQQKRLQHTFYFTFLSIFNIKR
jgi:hypothetical protein